MLYIIHIIKSKRFVNFSIDKSEYIIEEQIHNAKEQNRIAIDTFVDTGIRNNNDKSILLSVSFKKIVS